MSRLADPGKRAKDHETARQLRLAAWQRPTDQLARDQLRAERIADARAAMATEAARPKQQLTVAAKGRVR
jgi:hypothetical protein